MKKIRLSTKERAIENALLKGEYRPVSEARCKAIAQAVARRKKDAVLHIRMNRQDLEGLKKKARHIGVPYQSFISEVLHNFAAY